MLENKNFAAVSAKSAATVDEGLRQYMIKVYNYMTAGLCLTAFAAYLVANTSLIRLFFNITPQGASLSGLGWLFLLAPFLMIFAFGWVINRGTLQQVQGVFWGFSAVMGISLAPIFLTYTGDSITRLFLITAATFGGMSIYGYTTKRDLTAMGSFMVMGLWGVIIASIVNIFMQSSGLSFALSILTVIIFTGLTAYDTQKIRSLYLSADTGDTLSRKAIAGALEFYLDFINLFLALLRLFGDRR